MSDNIILSMDPGIRGCGCAAWSGKLLVAAAYVENSEEKGAGPAECAAMAREVCAWALSHGTPTRFVVEFPQTYGGRAARGDANDLLPLAGVAAAVAALLPLADVTYYRPHEWKGSVNADAMIERIKGRLSPEEAAAVCLPSAKSLHHNVADGVGVGLKYAGRLERRRVYSSG